VATTPWKGAGTALTYAQGGDTGSWSNVGNIAASDDSFASSGNLVGGQVSETLRASNFGFSTADIPSGSTINGIEIRIERRTGGPGVRDSLLKLALISAGTAADQVGNNKANTGSDWPTVDTQATYGGAADVWGTSLTDANLRSTNFAVDLITIVPGGTPRNCLVDFIEARITYTAPPKTAFYAEMWA
jgi:hypothetical protein